MLTLLAFYPLLGGWFWAAAAIVALLPVYALLDPSQPDKGWWRLREVPRSATIVAIYLVAVAEIVAIGWASALIPDAGETAFAVCARARDAGECAALLAASASWAERLVAALWAVGLDTIGMTELGLRYRIGVTLSAVWFAAAAVPLWRAISVEEWPRAGRSRWPDWAAAACVVVAVIGPFGLSAQAHLRLTDDARPLEDFADCRLDDDIARATGPLNGGHRLRTTLWSACLRQADRKAS